MLKISENNGTEEICLVTPTPAGQSSWPPFRSVYQTIYKGVAVQRCFFARCWAHIVLHMFSYTYKSEPIVIYLQWDHKIRKTHDDVITWKHFPSFWSIVKRIHLSPVNSTQKGRWRGALIFSLMCAWTNDWANNRDVGDLTRHDAHCDVTVAMQGISYQGYLPF